MPFLNKKNDRSVAGLIIKTRTPDQPESTQEDPDDKDAAIHACSRDLLKAIESKNIPGISDAIRSAFEILDSMPHIEGEHVEPHSYEAQNKKAGENR